MWIRNAVEVFNRYGRPAILQTDNGGEFIDLVELETYREMGIEVRHGRPYTPQSQGAIESYGE